MSQNYGLVTSINGLDRKVMLVWKHNGYKHFMSARDYIHYVHLVVRAGVQNIHLVWRSATWLGAGCGTSSAAAGFCWCAGELLPREYYRPSQRTFSRCSTVPRTWTSGLLSNVKEPPYPDELFTGRWSWASREERVNCACCLKPFGEPPECTEPGNICIGIRGHLGK